MTKVIRVQSGIITLNESKVVCPHCGRHIPFSEIENKWMKQDKHYMRMKCRCKEFIGITSTIMGDFVAYELNQTNQQEDK